MKMNKAISIFFLSLFITSCNGINDKSKRNTEWLWWVEKGSSKGEWIKNSSQDNNVKDGKFISFYSNGAIYSKGHLVDGQLFDTLYIFDLKERLTKKEVYYKDSVTKEIFTEGQLQFYYDDTTLKEEGRVVNGKRDGIWKFFFDNGKLKKVIEFKNGIQDGKILSYYNSGQISDSSYAINFKQFGEVKFWFENGQLREISNYKDGKREGSSVCYHPNGKIAATVNYIEGKEVGIRKGWFESGKLDYSETYEEGKLNGSFKSWFENGNLKYEGFFKNDLEDSLVKVFYENGQLRGKGQYSKGEIVGEWESFNEKGQPINRKNFN